MKLLTAWALLFSLTAQAALNVERRAPVATAASNQFVTSISASGATTLAQPDFTNLAGSATSAQLPVTGQAAVASGNVFMTAATSCPTGSIAANGSSLLRSGGTSCGGGSCAALFTAISTTYGSADGTHFTLPDMRGVFSRGAGSQTISALTYTGTQGTTQNDTTKKNGLALTDPGHIHQMTVWNNGATNTGNFVPAYANTSFANGSGNNNGSQTAVGNPIATSTTGVTLGTGDSETRPANISLLYCIIY